MFAFWSLVAGVLQGAAAGCRWKVLVRMVFALLSLVAEVQRCCQNAVCALELGCWCRCRVPLQSAVCASDLGCRHRCRVPLQGGAVCAVGLGWCRCRVLQGAAGGCCCPMHGAVGRRCRVLPCLSEFCLLFGAWLLAPLQCAAAGCCFVCALKLGCWCRCRVPLQNAAFRCRCRAAVRVLLPCALGLR